MRKQLCCGFCDEYMQLALDSILGDRVVGACTDVKNEVYLADIEAHSLSGVKMITAAPGSRASIAALSITR